MGNTSQYFHSLMIKQSKPKTFWYLWLILIGCSEFGPSVVLCNPPGRMLQVFVAYGKLHFQVHLRYQQKNIYLAFKELQVAAWACHRCSQMFTMFDKYAPSDPQKTSGKSVAGDPRGSPHCVASHSSLAWCVVATWAEARMFEVLTILCDTKICGGFANSTGSFQIFFVISF